MSESTKYLNFNLGHECFAIPLLKVREVIACPQVTPIPHPPPHFTGITNLRGQIIAIVDLRSCLNVVAEKADENAVIICDFETESIGLVVDAVNSVMSLAGSQLSPVPSISQSASTRYVDQVYRSEDALIMLLDVDRLLSEETKHKIQELTKQVS